MTGAIVFLFHQGASFIEAMKVILSTSLDRLLMYISKDEDAAACLDTNITKADKTAAVIRSEICRNITVFTSDKIVQEALTPSEDGSRTPICWSDLEQEDIFVRMDLSRMGQLDKLLRSELIQIVKEFVCVNFVEQGLGVVTAIHEGKTGHDLSKYNPHAHILVTTRTIGQDGFSSKKDREHDKRKYIDVWREQ